MAYIKTTWEDLPSEDTPITVTSLNNIEDGIEDIDNVTRYITATAGSNGDYKVNIPNTLETNMALNISFPTATSNTQNARLSIDNGNNYKNIKFFDAVQVLASEIETTFQKLYYNGTDFILLNEYYSRSNANGSYMKYADGTLIQKGTGTAPATVGYANITFPIPFLNAEYIIIANHKYTSGVGYGGSLQLRNITNPQADSATSAFVYSYIYDGSVADHIRNVQYVAFGQWK